LKPPLSRNRDRCEASSIGNSRGRAEVRLATSFRAPKVTAHPLGTVLGRTPSKSENVSLIQIKGRSERGQVPRKSECETRVRQPPKVRRALRNRLGAGRIWSSHSAHEGTSFRAQAYPRAQFRRHHLLCDYWIAGARRLSEIDRGLAMCARM
jgi:hypothetical protein